MVEKRKGFGLVIDKLVFLQQFLSFIMISSLILIVFVQVILRIFKLPLMGIEELLIFPTIWLYMLGASNASEERSHIVVDIVETFAKGETFLKVFVLIKVIVSAAISLVLTYWGFGLFEYSLSLWKYSAVLSLPMFFAESAVFIGLALMSIYSISDVVKHIKTFRTGSDIEESVGDQ